MSSVRKGWPARRIARELGLGLTSVRTALRALGCTPARPKARAPVQERYGQRIADLHDIGCSDWQIAGALAHLSQFLTKKDEG